MRRPCQTRFSHAWRSCHQNRQPLGRSDAQPCFGASFALEVPPTAGLILGRGRRPWGIGARRKDHGFPLGQQCAEVPDPSHGQPAGSLVHAQRTTHECDGGGSRGLKRRGASRGLWVGISDFTVQSQQAMGCDVPHVRGVYALQQGEESQGDGQVELGQLSRVAGWMHMEGQGLSGPAHLQALQG